MTRCAMFAAVLLLCAGCSKTGGDPVAVNAVGAATVADLAAASLGGGTQGSTSQMEALARFSLGGGLPKRAAGADLRPFDTTIVRDKGDGLVTYHYVITYRLTVSNLGDRANVQATVKGTLDTPRLSNADSASAGLTLDHLADGDSAVTLNENWRRDGVTTTKGASPVTLRCTMTAVFTDVRISKDAGTILAGSGLLTVSGTASTGGAFSYVVAVTFLGGGEAELRIGGSSFRADLATGAVVDGAAE